MEGIAVNKLVYEKNLYKFKKRNCEYDTEIMPEPLPRNIHAKKGLAAFRRSRNGIIYAEAFQS